MNTRASAGTRKAAKRASPLLPRRLGSIGWMLQSPLIQGALLFSGLVLICQLLLMALHPSWLETANQWLRAGLAWGELLCVAAASIALTRFRRSEALAWGFFTLGIAAYTFAQISQFWPHQMAVPAASGIPPLNDLVALLQYPCFFLALAFLPGVSRRGQPAMSRAKVVLDSLLLMSAGTALSWYFFLAPIVLQSGQSTLSKALDLASPVGDLGLLFGLTMVVARQGSREVGRVAIHILIAAVICLIVADSWYAYLNLYAMGLQSAPVSLLWVASYLLFGTAGLARLCIARQEAAAARGRNTSDSGPYPLVSRGAGPLRLLLPFMTALLASALIIARAVLAPTRATGGLTVPFAVSLGLGVLVLLRQVVTALENERLLRNEQRRREELRQANQLVHRQRQQLAERNQRLEPDIAHLKEVHARVANGDYTARAHIERGELFPIAGSLNLMLERLTHLSRMNAEYVKLDDAIRRVVTAAQGMLNGDEQAQDALVPTNTVLDGVVVALGQLRTRLREMEMGARQLELACQTARELSELAVQQGQFVTSEAVAFVGAAKTLGRLADELERAVQMLERHLETLTPENRVLLMQIVELLRQQAQRSRQQQAEAELQAKRFAKMEASASVATIGSRRLAAELETTARSAGLQIPPGTASAPATPASPPSATNGAHAAEKQAAPDSRASNEGSVSAALDRKPTAPLL